MHQNRHLQARGDAVNAYFDDPVDGAGLGDVASSLIYLTCARAPRERLPFDDAAVLVVADCGEGVVLARLERLLGRLDLDARHMGRLDMRPCICRLEDHHVVTQ